MSGAEATGAVKEKPKWEPMVAPVITPATGVLADLSSSNTRVNGPVTALLLDVEKRDGFVDLTGQNPAVIARDPQAELKPFKFTTDDGSTAYAVWITDPSQIPSGQANDILAQRLRPHWKGALGMLMVANPKRDILSIIDVHGVHSNTWSPYAEEGRPAWHGLGGNMIFNAAHIEAADLAALTGALFTFTERATEVVDKDTGEVKLKDGQPIIRTQTNSALGSANFQAWKNTMAAFIMVAGKATYMTLKYVLIDKTLAAMGVKSTEMGGAKAITLADPADKSASLLMLGQAAKVLGAYISGPDEGNGGLASPVQVRDQEIRFQPDAMAVEAPFHMAGATNADPRVTGLGTKTSFATASGVYSGITKFLDRVENPNGGIFLQGAGGVGSELIPMAIRDGRNITAVSDITASGLMKAKASLGDRQVAYIFDQKAAKEILKASDFDAQLALAREQGFIIADGLADSLRKAKEAGASIDLFSPNAGSHPVNLDVVAALKEVGAKAVIGAANNVLATGRYNPSTSLTDDPSSLVDEASYMPVGKALLEAGIFAPHDSQINQGGAASVLFGALGLTVGDIPRMADKIGDSAMEEYDEAFLKGMVPQQWRDAQAMTAWNAEIDAGRAQGGRFEIPNVEVSSDGSNGPAGSGGGEQVLQLDTPGMTLDTEGIVLGKGAEASADTVGTSVLDLSKVQARDPQAQGGKAVHHAVARTGTVHAGVLARGVSVRRAPALGGVH